MYLTPTPLAPSAQDPRSIRAVLFDIDGTLLSFRTHQMPASTVAALRALKAAGIAPILATGRPPYQLKHMDLSLFSAVMTFNGQLCFLPADTEPQAATSAPASVGSADTSDKNPLAGARVLIRHTLSPAAVEAAVALAEQDAYAWLFMEEDCWYLSEVSDRVKALSSQVESSFEVDAPARALGREIFQLNVFAPPAYDAVVDATLGEVRSVRWSELFSDVMPQDGGKAQGAARILEALGLTPTQAAAFGDGGNDADMLSAMGIGVAMGNGTPDAKAAANYICPDVDHDGIYRACVELGFIAPDPSVPTTDTCS